MSASEWQKTSIFQRITGYDEFVMAHSAEPKLKHSAHGALFVAAGILLSRISGLIRMRVLAHFLGDSSAADAFYAALKVPNFLQNLFGEGVLSASFIPVYANYVARGDREQAGKVAGAILSLLALSVSILVLLGIVFTPDLIDLIAPGFEGEKRDLTIRIVQIIFPGTGLLVLSAWCLGILNSHHKFFLSYAAPVVWNGSIILLLLLFRHEPSQSQLAVHAAWGLVLGSALQFAVQLPTALSLIDHLKFQLGLKLEGTRQILKSFVPVVFGRGVVQLSAYIDNVLASFLPTGAVAVLGYAQSIYMLPISLFGMSVSAAELPAMSSAYGSANLAETLRARLNSGARRIALMVVPSTVGLLLLGDVVAALLFQTGQFDSQTTLYVWGALAGSAIGLLASTLGRLYSSAFYSLRDTRTPLYFSIVRVISTTVLGYIVGLKAPHFFGINAIWGTAGIALASGIAGWVEYYFLRRSLIRRIGHAGLPSSFTMKLWFAAVLCGALGLAMKSVLPPMHPALRGALVVGLFGFVYFPFTAALGVEESKSLLRRVLSKAGLR